jgi:adenosine deaminase
MRLRSAEPTPALQGASLVGEYALCRQSFGWRDAMIKSVAQTSIDASFASVDVKAQLLAALKDW